MFLENDFARPLFDFKKGGPPQAYICRMCSCGGSFLNTCVLSIDHTLCGKLTKTEQGMRAHLKSVHGWKEQECLYSTDEMTQRVDYVNKALFDGNPRELRLLTPENLEATIKPSSILATEPEAEAPAEQPQLTEPEMNEKSSQKPMNEGS